LLCRSLFHRSQRGDVIVHNEPVAAWQGVDPTEVSFPGIAHNGANGSTFALVEPPELHEGDLGSVGEGHAYAASRRAASVAVSRTYSDKVIPRLAAAARRVSFSSGETRSLMFSIIAALRRIVTVS
jgi:hypothetical protein